ncbi:hypothetical protein YC2023_011300 [Brassica napus]
MGSGGYVSFLTVPLFDHKRTRKGNKERNLEKRINHHSSEIENFTVISPLHIRVSKQQSQHNRGYERDEALVVVHADHTYELFSQPISQAQTISPLQRTTRSQRNAEEVDVAIVERKSVGWKKEVLSVGVRNKTTI